ncbi:TetR/AcrR family transcriptional regulator [Pseudomonas sp. SG20056]|uniref:TetR/AcrR family transcriptional regulator n=1 Tax=Pseudomonas sp. SG20056 TaxID=3074146 RepID=UPI00287FAE2F|nr:TetR/AcrR family transcriptional regulator [Pseudomonas sp. SG20056]WNF48114.1 TetR/AcrR family transcriptional regulator [Pseudomonas sp. SG20056]
MATNKERREATRESIINAARIHFADSRYEHTHTDSILEHAGVSRGALYHYFDSKKDLFEAVFVSVVKETTADAARTGKGGDSALADLTEACLAWLRSVRQPEVGTILLDQGPQVLGWKRAREIEAQWSMGPMTMGLERAITAGEIDVASVELTSMLLNALIGEMALISLHQKCKATADEQELAIRQFIDGLRRTQSC